MPLGFASPNSEITLERRAWSPIDGAPAGAWSVSQGADGLIWFASSGGVYRYDGEKFTKVSKIYGYALRSNNVVLVHPTSRGIAVLYQFGGMSVFTPSKVTHYGAEDGLPRGQYRDIRETSDGTLYLATPAGVAMLAGGRWQILKDVGLPEGAVDRIRVGSDGALWVTVEHQLYARPKDGRRFSAVLSGDFRLFTLNDQLAAIDPQGKLVLLHYGKSPTVLLDAVLAKTDKVFTGPASTLWLWHGTGNVRRLRLQNDGRYVLGEKVEEVGAVNGFAGSWLTDREDNVWLCTANGVEKLRAQRIHEVPLPENIYLPYVHRGLDDSIVVAGIVTSGVFRIDNAGLMKAFDLPEVQAMWRENPDSLWAGTPSALFHITRRGITKWPRPGAPSSAHVIQAITVDTVGAIWVSITRQGLYRFADGKWTWIDTGVIGPDAIPITLAPSVSGGVWLGFTDGRIGQLLNGVVRAVPRSEIGNVLSLAVVNDGLIAGGERGIAWIDQRGGRTIVPDQIQAFVGVSGLVVDRLGNLWAHGTEGIYLIAKDELRRSRADARYRPKWQLFSIADGVRGNAAQIRPLPTLTASGDGRIFFATNIQVGWIDPTSWRRNMRAPDVLIQAIRVGEAEFEPKPALQLDAGTNALDIKYAVTALSIPEKAQIKYRLSGVDRHWQIPTGERVARYTNLEPGHYTFQVIAANEDGVWNNVGATLKFEILPEFWQTGWFRTAVVALLVAIVIAFHRWRLSAAAARSAERTAARMEERERIARTLHDNLLQGVHAMILRSSTILNRLPKGSHEERILEDVLDQAEKLVEDTRDEVMALRDKQPPEEIVAELRQELDAMAPSLQGRLQFSVSAGVDRIRPEVVRELCQVIKEAVSNAARHSGAREIIARLLVTADRVEGAISDDGVGIAPNVALNGVPGHWGIVGMRERVTKLGGILTIEKYGDAGTMVRFVLASPTTFN